MAALLARRSRTASRGRRGRRSSVLLRPLRFVDADRVDRRQVEDVEAELGESRDLLLDRLAGRPSERGNSSYQEAKRGARRGRPRCVSGGVELVGAVALGGALDGGEQLRGRARRRAWRLGHVGVVEHARARARSACLSAPLARVGGLLEQHDALGQLAGEVVLRRRRSCAAARRARWRRRRSRPRSSTPSGPCASTANSPSQRTPLRCASIGAHRRLDPAAARRARGSARRRAGSRGRRGRRRRSTCDRVADARAWRDSARRRPWAAGYWMTDARTGCPWCWVPALGREYPQRTRCQTSRDRSPAFQRRPAAPDLAARRPPRAARRYAWVDWLAEAGQTWWQMLPLGPAGPLPLALQGGARRSPPGRGCWPSRARRCRRPRSSTSASARRYWIEDWARFGRRAARSPTRCASTASGPRCARYAAERGVRIIGDVPIYVAPGSADHRAHPELFRDGARRRHAAGRLHRQGPAVGQPALRLARDAAPRLPLVGRRGSRRTFALFDLARIDHFRGFVSYWAVPGGRAHALERPLEARAGAGGVRRRRARRWSASCR